MTSIDLFAFWSHPAGDSALIVKLAICFLLGVGAIVACSFAPLRARRAIVGGATFIAGAYWVLYYLWPQSISRGPLDVPVGTVESVGFWLEDAKPIVSVFAQVITAFLLGLGVYSLLRIHLGRLFKKQKDWEFSLVLLVCIALMATFGYADWRARTFLEGKEGLTDPANWGFIQYARDFFFDGMLQELDAAMFSIIAFFILSAAYRAFRIRSVEATILLSAALIVMLSLMGAVAYVWGELMLTLGGGNPDSFVTNFGLREISMWLQNYVQTPSLRAIDFGIGVGALAMGLRLWLSLERGGIGAR